MHREKEKYKAIRCYYYTQVHVLTLRVPAVLRLCNFCSPPFLTFLSTDLQGGRYLHL